MAPLLIHLCIQEHILSSQLGLLLLQLARLPVAAAAGKQVTTIEGLQDAATGKLDEIQQAFVDHTAFQCGFCTPGIILASRALLNRNPSPTEADIKDALAGHYCRCISHYQVVEALQTLKGKKKK